MTFKKSSFLWSIAFVFFFGLSFSLLAYHYKLLDLGSWDEVLYVHRGYFLGLVADWGPIYSLYYRLFSPMTTDPVTLYFLGRLTMQFILLPNVWKRTCVNISWNLRTNGWMKTCAKCSSIK